MFSIPATIILFPLIVLFIFGVYFVIVYNSLVSLKVKVKEAWSGIDVQLKRRTDLIPNLIETVKGYASHEKEVFENVTKARSALMGATNPSQAQEANGMLTSALKSLFAISEAYPQLRASENFTNLQNELSDTESKISYARQFYNSVVRDFNSKIVMFPSNLIASTLGFKQEVFFEANEEEKQPVKVQF
ncbi:hypothetical protein A3H26_03845 [candidate division WWE3 bacterium RIFCSPLOWO2_12_FULL_36_10]|uniref:LemA family protein n=1 Tax=candidate division WWE3 bacterium RIFCSPLOWO2_12_FULL_36_10 TaxID=1802630 RepID=A0A1F4VLL0_UNCKA|nr:MAG: hypothetical protein A3H26_03845 [candidate division WWE3 bacterium RIFCSPLOWO2_12_FULL_36_10]